MCKWFYLALLALCSAEVQDEVTEGTELLMTFLVHRHGDRTPINSFISMSNDPEAVEAATAPYGYGQLTDKGRRRGYQLGQYIKSRYCDLLSPKYNQSTVYFRSTDSTRAKMTVLTALAAIYPPTPDSWSDSIHWVPVPYTTLPARYDYNLGIINCPKLISGIYSLMLSPSTRLSAYDSVLNVLSEEVNYNLTVYNGMLYALYDLYISQKSLGIPLTDYVEENWDIITEAAGGAINLVFGNDNLIGLQAGTFLQEFFNVTDDILNGTETQRLRIYSAHDFNVYSLAEVSQITPSIGVPVYASSLALELRQVTETGQIVVLPVYVPSPGDEPEYRYIAGCGDSVLCDLETFRDITSPNLMDFSQWRTNCGYYDDMEIDVSTI